MTLNVGIVGYGNIGKLHHRVVDSCPGAHVTAVVSRSATPASVRTVPTLSTLLEDVDVDVIAICTPSGLHAQQALEVARAGKHVVVEKPLTLDLATGAAAVREVRHRGTCLSVISQHRFAPPVRQLKELQASGRLGAGIFGGILQRWHRGQDYYDSALWRGTRALDGGVLMNQAIHGIDLLRYLLGPVTEVFAACNTLGHEMEAEDTAAATMTFASGAVGSIGATTGMPEGLPAQLTAIWRDGAVVLAGTRIAHWQMPDAPPPEDHDNTSDGADAPMDIGLTEHRRQWLDIVEAVTAGRDPLVTGEDGLATAAVVLAMYRSWREHRRVRPQYQTTP